MVNLPKNPTPHFLDLKDINFPTKKPMNKTVLHNMVKIIEENKKITENLTSNNNENFL